MRNFRIVLLFGCLSAFLPGAKERGHERHDVSIENLQYRPAEITIMAGDTVVWTNNDDRDHTVIAKDDSFRSPNLRIGMTFEHTFTRAGRYPYGCKYHPRMSGVVIVKAK